MKNKQYILLDLDGTIVDSRLGITNCVKYALQELGQPIPNDTVLKRFIGPPLVDAFMEYTHLSKEDSETAVKKYRERYPEKGIFECEVYEGIEDMLKALKESGKALILATCKPKPYADKILQHFGLMDYFSLTVGAELNGRLNYKKDVINEIIKLMAIEDTSKMVMIGDRDQDINGAKAVGISSIGVSYGFAEPNELESAGADIIAKSPMELCEILI